jgi:hypothetical protein
VRARLVVATNKLTQHGPQVALVHNDDVVEALPAKRADEPLSDAVCLRRGDRREYRADADALRSRNEVSAVATVTVAKEVTRSAAPRAWPRSADARPTTPSDAR